MLYYFFFALGWTCRDMVNQNILILILNHIFFWMIHRNPWLPGWILTTTLVLSILALIWICCATVATAVDQYVPAEVGLSWHICVILTPFFMSVWYISHCPKTSKNGLMAWSYPTINICYIDYLLISASYAICYAIGVCTLQGLWIEV